MGCGTSKTINSRHSKYNSEKEGISKQGAIHFEEGDIESKYRFKKQLGAGAFGEVQLATHIESGALRAIKCLPKSELDSSEKRK